MIKEHIWRHCQSPGLDLKLHLMLPLRRDNPQGIHSRYTFSIWCKKTGVSWDFSNNLPHHFYTAHTYRILCIYMHYVQQSIWLPTACVIVHYYSLTNFLISKECAIYLRSPLNRENQWHMQIISWSQFNVKNQQNRARQLYKNISMLFLFPVKDGKLRTGVNATFDASCYG